MLDKLRLPGLGGWSEDPLWASFYDWSVKHPRAGGLVWKAGIGSDLSRLYTAAADIAPAMLGRTLDAARERGVADQVETQVADVGALPFGDGEFDLVVSFTGLHCFPDPHRAMLEMGRVTHPGGVLTGSALLNTPPFSSGGLRTVPVRRIGRLSGLLGPSATKAEVLSWMVEAGFEEITLEMSGAIGYFRGVRGQ